MRFGSAGFLMLLAHGVISQDYASGGYNLVGPVLSLRCRPICSLASIGEMLASSSHLALLLRCAGNTWMVGGSMGRNRLCCERSHQHDAIHIVAGVL